MPAYRTLDQARLRHRNLQGQGVDALIRHLRSSPDIARSIVASRRLPALPARFAAFPPDLEPGLRAALASRGWSGLYTHQAQAWDAVRAGQDTVVVTPTASGKTLCYNLPILQGLREDPGSRALCLYPTKALSRDQLAELTALIGDSGDPIPADVYDGDTPDSLRAALRQTGRVILSNPDMLHAAILPNHTRWIGFFQGLRWIVIDEMHQYRGVFGSHVANVLRRLQRICAFYGASPRIIATSATIGNPGELAQTLTGRPVTVIAESGAPQGEREIWLCQTDLVNPTTGARRSPLDLACHLAAEAMEAGNPTILFCRGRMEVEIALTLLRERVPGVESYRGGYLPSERRAVERRLRRGELPGVVSTNALELGIDIGSLDVAISCGYPGTLASARQQMGRAGRRQSTSLAILVADNRPLDQYLLRHPEFFFDRSPEHAIADPDNDLIRATQLRCAAFELPFPWDEEFGGPDTREFLEFLTAEGHLHFASGRYYWNTDTFPAREVSLRAADDENVVIIDQGPPETVLGEMDRASAVTALHDQAIYVHRGQQYHVDRLDYAERKAWVTRVDVEYYTQAELQVELKVLDVEQAESSGIATARAGEVTLAIIPTVFKKLKIHGNENIGAGPIRLPEERFQSGAFWLEWPATPGLDPAELEEALAGTAALLHGVAPLYAMCDRGDLGAVAKVRSIETHLPTVYLYDRYPGGVGLAERLFGARPHLLATALETLLGCPCDAGCPACAGPSLSPDSRRKGLVSRLLSLAT